jgi:hypothetical protein
VRINFHHLTGRYHADRSPALSKCQDFVKIEDSTDSDTEPSGRDSCSFDESEGEPNAPENVPTERRAGNPLKQRNLRGFVPTGDEPQASRRVPEDLPSSHERAKRVKWLGGRDSNPDNLVQSQVSYR